MQLHNHSSSTTDDNESDTYRGHIKRPRHSRRKKIEHTENQNSVLEYQNENEENDRLPDLVRDTNVYRTNATFPDNTSDDQNKNNNIRDFSTEANMTDCNPSGMEISNMDVIKKKFSLPNNLIDESSIKDTLKDSGNETTKKKLSLPTDLTGSRQAMDNKVEEFMNEVISSISEMGNANPEAVRKLRGIIKRTLSGDKEGTGNVICSIKRQGKPKNKVHFSEENITIEIPRTPTSTFNEVRDILCYFCCFGFLFPNV